MSLYNMLFGVNFAAHTLLAMIGVDATDVPRFRDCFLKGNTIVIYTRTGGGNRQYYAAENARLRNVPGFLDDHDDGFDSTFAYFAYAIPQDYVAACEVLRKQGADRDPAVEWPRLLGKLRDPAMKNDPEVVAVLARSKPLMDKIEDAFNRPSDGVNVIEV